MKNFFLETGTIIQGTFDIKELNLMLVFQVNCPGCFLYSLPVANKLYDKYNIEKEVNIIGLSTAFEDFQFNTLENTRLFLEKQYLVGETKKIFQSRGLEKYPVRINFPVAFDLTINQQELFTKYDINLIINRILEVKKIKDKAERELTIKYLKNHFASQPVLAYTFTTNQLNGTPSWILFDSQYSILESWFGHKSDSDIESIIEYYLR